MFLNRAFVSGLLLAPVILGARIARRSRHQSTLNCPFSIMNGTDPSGGVFSTNWAGAVWAESNNTFTSVTGTLTVPTPSGEDGTSASAWVGIDGNTCQNAILQTGISFTVESGQPQYTAWYEWYPGSADYFLDITISAGDVVKLTVTASSSTTGTATIKNLTRGQTVFKDLSSTAALCGQNAEWIVEDYQDNGVPVPFADFGTVRFMDAEATGTGTYTPSGAIIWELIEDGEVVTSVSTDGSSVTIKYV